METNTPPVKIAQDALPQKESVLTRVENISGGVLSVIFTELVNHPQLVQMIVDAALKSDRR